MTFVNLWRVEVRRSLHRRVVWILILVALIGIGVLGVIAFTTSTDLNVGLIHARGEHHPAIMADWWIAGEGENVLSVTAFFLLMGALIGGASVVGGEWRAGTVTTVLTWEPVRGRLHAARIVAATAC